ncbi:MAG: hypothetical protein MHM6MM_001275 [Cercozoa sp. M6MM]
MEGDPDDNVQRGVIPRAFKRIFDHISDCAGDTEYLVRASFLEIYNDEAYDLLHSKKARRRLELHQDSDGAFFVQDLTEITARSPSELMEVLRRGQKSRSVGATKMNPGSSRSHSIFQVQIESCVTHEDTKTYKRGKLNLVDLAGSERQKKTESTGERFLEAKNINLSLAALGNCIKALTTASSQHVPFRDSKLTRLLKDSLGGNTRTAMIATIGPCSFNHDETVNTLRYANRAKTIKNRPHINEDPKDAKLRMMKEELDNLRKTLALQVGGTLEVQEGRTIVGEEVEDEQMKQQIKSERAKLAEMQRELQKRQSQQVAEHDTMRKEAKELEAQLRKHERTMEQRERAVDKLRAVIADKESMLLHGHAGDDESGIGLSELKQQMQERKEALNRIRSQTAALKDQGELIEREIQQVDEELTEISRSCTSLEEELTMLKQHTSECRQHCARIDEEKQDIQAEFDTERDELVESMRALTSQLRLKNMMVRRLIPEKWFSVIESMAGWDPRDECWRLPAADLACNGEEPSIPVTSQREHRIRTAVRERIVEHLAAESAPHNSDEWNEVEVDREQVEELEDVFFSGISFDRPPYMSYEDVVGERVHRDM